MMMYKMTDVVDEISIRVNEPAKSGYSRFVGLEHYVPGEVVIRLFGSTEKLGSAMKVFQAGDILVARRNVYLRRASRVDFDGLTSGDSIVLRAKTDFMKKILPFILNTDDFWDFADQHADGTMSKRLSPKTLMQYEFSLPDEDKQDEFAEILCAADETREAYRKLLIKTDDLVKSQFIELFGRPGFDDKGWGLTILENCCVLNPRKPQGIADDLEVSFLAMPSVTEDGHMDLSVKKAFAEVKKGFTYFEERDVLFAKITPCMENGKGAVAEGLSNNIGMGSTEFHVLRPIAGKSNPYWLYVITMFKAFRVNARKIMTGTGGQLRVPITYLQNYSISVPPIELQDKFEKFYKQTANSKFEIQQALDNLNATIRALVQQEF